ncbi:MAG: universal stress protein [Pseudomonadota bacterium]
MRLFSNALYVADEQLEREALARAFELVRQHQAQLTIIDVIPEPSHSETAAFGEGGKYELAGRLQAARAAKLRELIVEFEGGEQIAIIQRVGRRYLEAIKVAIAQGFDLVIKLAERPAWLGRLFTSDDMHLLRKCPCPVYLMHRDTPEQPRVLAAIDLDPDDEPDKRDAINQRILDFAAATAAFEDAELHIAHAWESPVAGFAALWTDMPDEAEQRYSDGEYALRKDLMDAAVSRLRCSVPDETYEFLAPQSRLLQGRAEVRIPEVAQQLDASVVVMGTVARSGIPGLIIGNTAEDILQQLRCSILAIKPEGFESPVRIAD